jgi:hypothetical protein
MPITRRDQFRFGNDSTMQPMNGPKRRSSVAMDVPVPVSAQATAQPQPPEWLQQFMQMVKGGK